MRKVEDGKKQRTGENTKRTVELDPTISIIT